MEEEKSITALNIRLSAIEEQIKDLKTLMMDSVKQESHIQELEKDVSSLEKNEREIFQRLNALEQKPDKDSAKKWNYIADYIFKAVVAFCALYLLSKIGISVGN